MHIKYISINNFRGIKSLTSTFDQPLICLIGASDSTKTTVLDAIELALWPVYTKSITDLDFHDCILDEPIEIEVGVGDVPIALLSDQKFGHLKRGWTTTNQIRDEPDGDDSEFLSIRFQVDTDLEPTWTVFAERDEEGKPIFQRDRSLLGVVRLGTWSDRDLSWSRGTALSRMSSSDAKPSLSVLADAHRTARDQLDEDSLADLVAVAERAEEAARRLGVRPRHGFKPNLDISQLPSRSGSISLHDGLVPVQMAGLGTKRITTLAIQRVSVKEGAIALVDEIEHGIEPFRIRQLIQEFKKMSNYRPITNEESGLSSTIGQAVITTHSPIALVEFDASELRITRSEDGVTTLTQVPNQLQATVRASSEAFFASRVVVCEGKTELGLLKSLERHVAQRKHGAPLAFTATSLIEGGGSSAPRRATEMASLGYRILLFADSDVPLQPDVTELHESDIEVIQWSGCMSTESRVCSDVPRQALQKIVNLAACIKTPESVLGAIAQCLPNTPSLRSLNIDSWIDAGINEESIRNAIATAAQSDSQRWFKRIDYAEKLGEIVADVWTDMHSTNLVRAIDQIFEWAYSD